MLILGLDPGLGTTGWGMIRADGNRLSHVANGQIRTDASMPLPRRLALLHGAIVEVIRSHQPQGAAVEEVLGNSNAQSTLKLGQARGMALLAAAQAELVVGEYHPSIVKKAVVGTGGAAKEQVQAMVARLLPGVKLTGVLAEAAGDHAVIDVNGVGYLVQLSGKTLAALGGVGAQVKILTDMQVREDAITLFGFGSVAERDWFRLLTQVQGVGGRVALSILTVLAPDELSRAVASGDKAMVARANGVGPKLALRIVTELKDKAGPALGPVGGAASAAKSSAEADALSALANLGFRPAEASAAVGAAVEELGPDATIDALVRLALRKAAK